MQIEEKCMRTEALPPHGHGQGDIGKSEWNWMEWAVVVVVGINLSLFSVMMRL